MMTFILCRKVISWFERRSVLDNLFEIWPVYAIVDIETTGGSAKKQKITEIAIIVFDGKTILDRYETLINPEELIPRNIISLTGITNEMVESAPLFSEVADENQPPNIWNISKNLI